MIYRFALALIFIFSGVTISIACSCADTSVRGSFRNASVVFSGEVKSFDVLEKAFDGFFDYKAVFKVEKQWKGKKQNEIIALASTDEPGMCGDLDLKVGEKFLIYAPKRKGSYVIFRDCPSSVPLASADDDIKKLNNILYRLYTFFYPYPKF